MSRIDDADRQAQRAAERMALEKRQQEDRTKKRQEGESAFAKLVQQGQSQTKQTQQSRQTQNVAQQYAQATQHDEVTQPRGIVGEAIAQADEAHAKGTQDAARQQKLGKAFNERLKQAHAGEGERASEGRTRDAGREGMAAQGRTGDQQTSDVRAEARREDARMGRDSLSERGEAALAKGAQGGGAARGKGELKADQDGGGKGGSGGQSKDQQGGTNLGAGFRFNPALMAPVPVAKPKETVGSDRLRQLANEIAQKIVERVRVGTNAAGMAEFQIDLRSNVLSGMSIKVSGGNGKIKLAFSGGDKEVLKLLEQSAENLKTALGGRGLTLEELKIEERA